MTSHGQEELEFEIGVLASLVAELDERDDNSLRFTAELLTRLGKQHNFGPEYDELVPEAIHAVQRVIQGEGDFPAAYQLITRAIDTIYASMSPGKSITPSFGQPTTFDSSPQAFEASDSELLDFVSETEEYLLSAEMALLQLEKTPDSKEHIDEVFRCFHNVKGISGFFDLGDFQDLAHVAESLMEGIRSGRDALDERRAQLLFDAVDTLKAMLSSVRGAMSGGQYRTPENFEGLVDSIVKAENASPVEASKPHSPAKPSASKRALPPIQSRSDEVVRVPTTKLDALIDSVGELVIANGMVQQETVIGTSVESQFGANVQRLGKIVRELQEQAMALRMVSLEVTFQRLARVARDLSRESSVPVEFSFRGEETELDRSVVEEIQSPLVHMIRNAVDHGIEPVEERKKRGKPETGHVQVVAFHQGGNVVIRVEDDGQGLDKERILKKALKQGLVDPEAELSDEEVYRLIFEPGFSTNEQVTEVSGRGVGMDVVKRSIDKLRGRLEISSVPGEGTTFTIRLPLTMAIIDGMVMTVGSHHFLIPSLEIQEALRPQKDQVHFVTDGGEVVVVRGKVLPLFRLYQLFDIQGAKARPTDALVLVVNDGDNQCALLVDDLVGQQQVVVKPVATMFHRVPAISGATIMGDGSVALILDTEGILRMARG